MVTEREKLLAYMESKMKKTHWVISPGVYINDIDLTILYAEANTGWNSNTFSVELK